MRAHGTPGLTQPQRKPQVVAPAAVRSEIIAGNANRFGILDVVPFDEEDAKYVGLLQVEAA